MRGRRGELLHTDLLNFSILDFGLPAASNEGPTADSKDRLEELVGVFGHCFFENDWDRISRLLKDLAKLKISTLVPD